MNLDHRSVIERARGVAGAFIAVPTAAVVSQAIGYLRARPAVAAPP